MRIRYRGLTEQKESADHICNREDMGGWGSHHGRGRESLSADIRSKNIQRVGKVRKISLLYTVLKIGDMDKETGRLGKNVKDSQKQYS